MSLSQINRYELEQRQIYPLKIEPKTEPLIFLLFEPLKYLHFITKILMYLEYILLVFTHY